LTEPIGFKNSILAKTSQGSPTTQGPSSTRGVQPTVSEMRWKTRGGGGTARA
jgi:hypothetical protein